MKKYFSFILIAIFMTTFFSTTVFATTNNNIDQVINRVETLDAKINKEIQIAQFVADKIIASNLTSQETDRAIDMIINLLIQTTNMQVENVVQFAYDNGIIVIKQYITVEIGGRLVIIDPLRVWED